MNNNFSEQWNQIRKNIFEENVNSNLMSFFSEDFYNYVLKQVYFEGYEQLNLFLSANLKKFKIFVYDDNEQKPFDADFEVRVSRSHFIAMFSSINDVITNSIHRILHRFIANMWINVRVDKSIFSISELDFLEDIYIQSIVFQTMPYHAENYINQLNQFYGIFGYTKENDYYVEALSLMKSECFVNSEPMLIVHRWLYSQSRRLDLEVFEQFFYVFSKLKNVKEFHDYLQFTVLANQNSSRDSLMSQTGPISM